MVRIRKPTRVPKTLAKKGAEQTTKDCADYDSCPDAYQAGKRNLERYSYYNGKAVKQALMKAHYGKCCYCEKKYSEPRLLAVEHFRPKSGVKQARNKWAECPDKQTK